MFSVFKVLGNTVNAHNANEVQPADRCGLVGPSLVSGPGVTFMYNVHPLVATEAAKSGGRFRQHSLRGQDGLRSSVTRGGRKLSIREPTEWYA